MELKPIIDVNPKINQTEYYWFQNGFSEQELDWFQNLQNIYPYLPLETEYVIERQKEIKCDDLSMWVYDKLNNFAIEANNAIWGFELSSIIDPIRYNEFFVNGVHDWNLDIGSGINYRKITMITQLSDPSEYEGGDLEIWTNGQFKTIPKIKGCTTIFPSFLLHRVTPVISGLKKSMTLWVGGGNYK